MNKLTKKLKDTFNPFVAIIAYKSDCDGSYYLEQRKVHNGFMGAGKPLTQSMLAGIVNSLRLTTKQLNKGLHGAIPPTLLYCSTDIDVMRLVWYHGPENRRLFFSSNLDIPNGEMEVPGLVYSVNNGILFVYAFKGNKPKGVLYRAPFMNVYSDSHICLGNAKVTKPEDKTFENVINYWEKMFWMSEFSHILNGNPINGNLATITKDCIANGKPFPTDVLIKVDKKLKDLLR